jgi:hypothetical protein
MQKKSFLLESSKLFSQSLIWQLNHNYYEESGIDAWRNGTVPHHITSNSMVGKTYAELILGFLKDLSVQGCTEETIYLVELGAGHGRLAYHILQHLEKLIDLEDRELPSFCYILSDRVEKDLLFFKNHPQLQHYYKQGTLDYAYFDALESNEIHLRYSDKIIRAKDLKQPIISIANYFFDSLPNDLFILKNGEISVCSVSLESSIDPQLVDTTNLLKNLKLTYQNELIKTPYYSQPVFNEILEDYRNLGFDTYLFFPQKGIECMAKMAEFSKKGLMMLSLDKGYHEISNLNNKVEPEIIMHGSFSLWVNYHALGAYCKKKGGQSLFSSYSTFHLELACLLFVPSKTIFTNTIAAYERFVNDFGPDDFNSIKKLTYSNLMELKLIELIAILRLSAYDSTLFKKLLPQIKIASNTITIEERKRLAQTLHRVWHFYFNIGEPCDMAYEIGGLFYDLGFYKEALDYFGYSKKIHGPKVDTYYNSILCFYQLRQDFLFSSTLKEAKNKFPKDAQLEELEKLDLTAV